ncbi:hypothetical protein [Scytonema sp. HK-05]|nr:hypothetical protein [Scytonema sp. HK-05]
MYVCWKRQVYFAKVDHIETSQICPNCEAYTEKKFVAILKRAAEMTQTR